ncbi:AraC family transcriptional regulator [Denitromonas iodatirespirans]|uniref:AraC family transcriptional regulator n=1 Tax=Denitromonas iodatirespirans TaxID=2795389 RepID=A0A944DDW2_DENI1|nr:AraC family transcriptional regulator [Denitromonas iodatirespirans]MBT0962537.1 AraC family transcriptional regulator [Denitromonas iodatirespirans]
MDALSPIFERISLSTRIFFSGQLCLLTDFDASGGMGHLHLLKTGRVSVHTGTDKVCMVDRPSAILIPRPQRHRLEPLDDGGIDLVCALLDLGAGVRSPIAMALPDCLVLPIEAAQPVAPVLDLLFREAFGSRYGRQPALDRLAEYFMILVLRQVIDSGATPKGLFAGLADPRLARAITAMHEKPAHPWSLEQLADLAGMSRARFVVNFRDTLGETPHAYLTDWRLSIAQNRMRAGRPLKQVAAEVGYPNVAALARVFTRRFGKSPTAWLNERAPS